MMDKLKNINGHGWFCITVAVALALVDALAKFGGIELHIPTAVVTGLTAYAASKQTTKK